MLTIAKCKGALYDMQSMQDQVAIVTSATRGIGLACAKALAKRGAHVYLAVRRLEAGEEIAASIMEKGGQADAVYFDASKPETYTRMVRSVLDACGQVDILVNNYGSTQVERDKSVLQMDSADFLSIVQDNLRSVLLPVKAVLPAMMERHRGSIVNISSIGSVTPDLSRTAYVVAKASINALTQNIALQCADAGVRCNAVLPGLIATDAALEHMPTEFLSSFVRHVPLGRPGQPQDIADAVAFLASDEAAYITGTLLEVAGGFGLGTPQYAEFAAKGD